MITVEFTEQELGHLAALLTATRRRLRLRGEALIQIPDDYHLRELQERIEAVRLRQ